MKPGWTTVALGDVAEVRRTSVHPAHMRPDDPYLGLENIERGGRLLSVSTVAGEGVRSAKFRFSPGDVLYGKLRPNLAKILKVDFEGLCSTDILPIAVNSGILSADFLAYYLSQPQVVAQAASRASGANLPRLAPAELLALRIPLPPLDEQRRIAAILDASEGAIRRRDEQLVALDRLIFSRVPVGQDGAIPLGAALKTIESGRSPNCEARPAMADEWGVLKLGAVSYGSYRADENKALLEAGGGGARYEVNAGDVLMTRKNTRDLVGAVAYVVTTPARRLLPDLIYRLTLDESQILPQYFQALMMTPLMRGRVGALASGSAASMVNLSHAKIKSLELPLASMGQQREYVAFADKVGKMRQLVECARVADRELLTSLQSRAFRGEL